MSNPGESSRAWAQTLMGLTLAPVGQKHKKRSQCIDGRPWQRGRPRHTVSHPSCHWLTGASGAAAAGLRAKESRICFIGFLPPGGFAGAARPRSC